MIIKETVLRSVEDLRGYSIQATDGEIGRVDQFLFDDQTWTIRYLVINTGNWLLERLVLISPIAIRAIDWQQSLLEVDLTREQVELSPDIATDEPVSRQQEEEYFRYYRYPPYWGGPGLWGTGMYPPYAGYGGVGAPAAEMLPQPQPSPPQTEHQGDPHLRSTHEVVGYPIQARDGEIGHVEDFILDDATWSIRYMVVATRNWWPGKKVLVSPQWIEAVSWSARTVAVDLTRETVKQSPEYDPSKLLNREYEIRLHHYYQRSGYWENSAPRSRG
jgi:sporulation protein YlmC with PRC-barrel domain